MLRKHAKALDGFEQGLAYCLVYEMLAGTEYLRAFLAAAIAQAGVMRPPIPSILRRL
jgi:hypothetical protein